VSPDESRVAIQHWLHSEPIEILELRTGRSTEVMPPREFPMHDYGYPFTFVKWEADAKSLVVDVQGTALEKGVEGPKARLMAYREVWTIDAATAKASFVSRQEREWTKDRPRIRPEK
jgi:hypothetical protein